MSAAFPMSHPNPPRVQRFSLVCALALGLLACAPRAAPAAAPVSAGPPAPPEKTLLPRQVITPTDAADIDELFQRSEGELRAGHALSAAKGFDRIVAVDPNGPRTADALYEAALAHEQAGDRSAALERFEKLGRQFPKHALGRESLVRAVRLACFLERWKQAGELADLLTSRYSDLDPFESIVALSAKALAKIADNDPDGATFFIEKGRNIVDAHRLDAAGAVPRDLAQLYFALGEARRMRAEKIKFVPVPANFAVVLEERCQLLLDSQSAYSDAMRAYDAHWSAMAGFRVGELYQKLHEDLMAIPPPKAATNDAKAQLFEGAMRLRYSILLDKALTMMEHTLSMAKRTGEQSEWVVRAEDAKKKIERARQTEQDAIDRLPYTRAQLQQALDDLAKKAQEAESKHAKSKGKP